MIKHPIMSAAAAAGLLSAFCLTLANPALAAGPYELPIRLSDDNHMVMDVMVNDTGPYAFVVDTAAGMTVVFDRLVTAASLTEVENTSMVQVQGASGVIQAPFVYVGELAVDDWSFELDRAIALPTLTALSEDVYGILGANILLRQPVGFHLSDSSLRIYEEGEIIDPSDDLAGRWFEVSYENRSGIGQFMWTEVTVNGVAIQALIDTGARRTVINSAGVEALGLDPRSLDLVEDEPIRGGTNNSTPAWIQPVSTVQFGERVWGSRNLTLSDPSVLSALGVADQPTIIFGSDFLAEQDFIIDPVANVIWMQGRRSAALGGYSLPTSAIENSAANY